MMKIDILHQRTASSKTRITEKQEGLKSVAMSCYLGSQFKLTVANDYQKL